MNKTHHRVYLEEIPYTSQSVQAIGPIFNLLDKKYDALKYVTLWFYIPPDLPTPIEIFLTDSVNGVTFSNVTYLGIDLGGPYPVGVGYSPVDLICTVTPNRPFLQFQARSTTPNKKGSVFVDIVMFEYGDIPSQELYRWGKEDAAIS